MSTPSVSSWGVRSSRNSPGASRIVARTLNSTSRDGRDQQPARRQRARELAERGAGRGRAVGIEHVLMHRRGPNRAAAQPSSSSAS